ncbi:hypothetical protein CLU79DRAFT_686762, partial [Phycomyces nitens]
YQLRGQMAKEIVRKGENRSRKRQRVQDTQDHSDTEGTPNNGEEKEDANIWES